MTYSVVFYAILKDMLFTKTKSKRVLQTISVILIHTFLVSGIAFAVPDATKHTLSPPSRFWDEKTVRNIESGEIYGKSFRNRVASAVISSIIGDGLYRNGVSPYTLISKIRRFLSQAEIDITKERDPMLAGFELDELAYNEDKNEYYLPLYRNGVKTFYYRFYRDGNKKTADFTIPLGDGKNVYVDLAEGGKGTTFTIRLPVGKEKTQRLIKADTTEIPPEATLGEKAYKLIKMAQAGLNVPAFFVIVGDGSGEITITESLKTLFGRLKKPFIVRSSHKDEGTTYPFSGMFQSFKGITSLEATSTEILDESQDAYREEGPRVESLQSAYRLIVEFATDGYIIQKYLETHDITEFNPKQMNAVVMEEIDLDVFGMFVTSNQNNPDEVLIHYQVVDKYAEDEQRKPEDSFFGSRKEMGGVITYNKKTHELGENDLDEAIRKLLRQFGEVAEQIEEIFGVQQIELGASNGNVYVFQSRDINLTNPEDVPRLAHYKTMSEELNAIGYGYYHLPILVIDTMDDAHPEVEQSERYKQLQSAYMASGKRWEGKEWDELRQFTEAEKQKYRDELLQFQRDNPEYILVIKDAESVIDIEPLKGKNYDFLNNLVTNAKVVVRDRNQDAIRHEDWQSVELGAITIIPPEASGWGGFMDTFEYSRDKDEREGEHEFTRPSRKNSIVSLQEVGRLVTGDYLNVLSNTDGAFVWVGEALSPKKETFQQIGTVSPESEQAHATSLEDETKYIDEPTIIAVGTSSFPGYDDMRYPMHHTLNPLLTALKGPFNNKPVTFVVARDDALEDAIREQKKVKGYENAKVLVLAGKDTIQKLKNIKKTHKIGIDNKNLLIDNYIPLMEMLTVLIKFSKEDTQEEAIKRIQEEHPRLGAQLIDGFIVFELPKANPMDYENLREIYKLQTFA